MVLNRNRYYKIKGTNNSSGGGTTPVGVKDINANGAYDVTNYAVANVNVPIPNGYIMPSGTLEVTANGTHNVKEYESVNVNVASSGGSENTLNPVTNIVLNNGVLSWNTPDTSGYTVVSISYIVNVNGTELTSNTNSVNVSDYLVVGNNTVSVVAKAVMTVTKESSEVETIVEYSAPTSGEITVTTLSATLPQKVNNSSIASIGTNAYIFGGYVGGGVDTIFKFDSTTETTTTLSTTLPKKVEKSATASIGTNAYIFGGYDRTKYKGTDTIFKFDSTTETITTLNTKLPNVLSEGQAILIGTNAYIFVGNNDLIYKFDSTTETITTLSATLPQKVSVRLALIGTDIYLFSISNTINTIFKFDSTTETTTTLSTTLPKPLNGTATASIGTNAYIFGGYDNSISANVDTILEFDITTETITTLKAKLPQPLNGFNSALIDNIVYLFGGYGTSQLDTIIKISNLG